MHNALARFLGPGQRDWSPAGVYVYWDVQTHDILYLGLAGDLPTRFAQHNGLISHGGGNKSKEIDDYFSTNDRLGFTVLIQSKAIALMEEIQKLDFTMGTTADRTASVGEGQLIEMHRLAYGARPPWNRTGGALGGKRYATAATALLEVLAARRDSLFAARRPLRELADSFRFRLCEATIHAARMRAMMEAHDIASIPAPDEKINIGRIEKSMMLRDGHLVEDLNASDADIKRWLATQGDPAYWHDEAAKWRAAFDPIRDRLQDNEKAVLELLDATTDGGAPPEHIAAVRDILGGDYLDARAAIP